jgi:predicted permease
MKPLIRRKRLREKELDEEIRAHLAMDTRERIERGEAPAEAEANARREFGNATLVKEVTRDMWGWRWLETLLQDLRYGLRQLRRNPGFTAVAVVTLALGIGANTAIFSLVQAVLLRELPVRDPQSLVIVRALSRKGTQDWFSHTDYEWLRDHQQVFTALAATANWKLILNRGDHKERVGAEFASGNYFPVLGVKPMVGRMIDVDDDRLSRPVAVISYGYWQRAFGGDPNVLGRELRLEKTGVEIIGVTPLGFEGEYGDDPPDLWLPLNTQARVSGAGHSFLNTRNVSWLGLLGRLRPGITLGQARAAMGPLLASLRADLHVDSQNDYLGAIGVEPGGGGLSSLRDHYAQALRLLTVLVAVVLLIACGNVANLLLARSAARGREFAVRLAIGAGPARLVGQLLTESLLLAFIACVAGLAVARVFVDTLLALSNVTGLEVHINSSVLAFAVATSCAAALVFGFAPAMQSRRLDPWTTLKDAGTAGRFGNRLNPSRLLIVAQSALSVVLLVTSGLLLHSFLKLKAVNPGFDEQVLEANLDLSMVSGNTTALANRIVERLSTMPGVQGVAFSAFGFGEGKDRICCIAVEGYTPHVDEDKDMRVQSVSPGYFRTLGIQLLAGREFTPADRLGAPRVAVINEAMSRHYFGRANPVGKRFAWWPTAPKDIEIVGVVKDAKYDSLRQETLPLVYTPILQGGLSPNFLEMRGVPRAGRPSSALISDCRAAIRSIDANIRVVSFVPLTLVVARTLAPARLVSWLSTGFGILALLLTSVGLYGVLAYTVARRTCEFGIRIALGAQKSDVLNMVVGNGLKLTLIGIAIGIVGALGLTRFLSSFLYGVKPTDPLTFIAVSLILIAVAVLASYIPARRATKVNPMVALRHE